MIQQLFHAFQWFLPCFPLSWHGKSIKSTPLRLRIFRDTHFAEMFFMPFQTSCLCPSLGFSLFAFWPRPSSSLLLISVWTTADSLMAALLKNLKMKTGWGESIFFIWIWRKVLFVIIWFTDRQRVALIISLCPFSTHTFFAICQWNCLSTH